MTDEELRAMVRDAIARVRTPADVPSHLAPSDARSHLAPFAPSHSSHALFIVPDGSESGGPCIIEPAVMCTHCGYCKSLGH